MRQKLKWLMVVMLLLLLVACGKSTERKIAEQLELGQKYLTEGNYNKAIVAFVKAIEIEPKTEQAYTELAAVLLELGRYDEAIEILEKGSQEIPDSEEIRAQLEYQFPSVKASLEPGTYDEREMLELENENQFDIYYRIAGSGIDEDILYETAIGLGGNGTYEITYYAVNPDDRKGRQYSEVYTIELDPQKYTMNDWLQENGQWYYCDADGYPVTGWQEIDEQWYYFYEDGSMAHDEWIEDYYLGSDGAWIEGMQLAPNKESTDGYSNVMMRFHSDGDWQHRVTSQATQRDG